jgi:hypothetical protein
VGVKDEAGLLQAAPTHAVVTGSGLAPVARDVTWLAAGLALCAALAGLLVNGVYAGPAPTAAMLRGFDLVTAGLVVPALAVSIWRARGGSPVAELFAASLVAYLVYTYAYYLFGTGFNDLFLLHVATFSASLCALVLRLATLDLGAVERRFGERTRVRPVGVILAVLSFALGGMWLYVGLGNALTGDVPTGSLLVETDTVVRLGMALDLALLVPMYAISAVLLWRRLSWGYVAAAIALFSGAAHQVAYMVAMPFQVSAAVPGAVSYDASEPIIVALYVGGSVLLLLGGRARRVAPGSPSDRWEAVKPSTRG